MYAAVENPRARRCETDGRSSCFITNDASYLAGTVQAKEMAWWGQRGGSFDGFGATRSCLCGVNILPGGLVRLDRE